MTHIYQWGKPPHEVGTPQKNANKYSIVLKSTQKDMPIINFLSPFWYDHKILLASISNPSQAISISNIPERSRVYIFITHPVFNQTATTTSHQSNKILNKHYYITKKFFCTSPRAQFFTWTFINPSHAR